MLEYYCIPWWGVGEWGDAQQRVKNNMFQVLCSPWVNELARTDLVLLCGLPSRAFCCLVHCACAVQLHLYGRSGSVDLRILQILLLLHILSQSGMGKLLMTWCVTTCGGGFKTYMCGRCRRSPVLACVAAECGGCRPGRRCCEFLPTALSENI